MPRIGEWRGALEAQATRAIGVPVRIGAIEARSEGLFPTIELRDVALQDAQRRDALRLARVVAGVSPRSLWHLSFEQLYVERPEAQVRRDAQGRLHVAGLDLSADTGGGGDRAADWFFSQRELVVEGGTVQWSDELRAAPPLLLSDVRFVARNGARSHRLRLDATPPDGWGERFTLMGAFHQPLLSLRRSDWRRWDGELYAALPRIDVTRLGQYVTLDARIREGSGALRAWIDVEDGQPAGGAADLALARVDTVLGDRLEPLVLRQLTGRLTARNTPGLFEFSTRDLQFATGDGMRWPGGNVWFRRAAAHGRTPESGALRADRIDLGALALIANRLPLGDEIRGVIARRAPRGLVEDIDVAWQGPLDAPTAWQAKGSVKGLSLASSVEALTPAARIAQARPPVGVPGIRGLDARFDMTQAGGRASLAMASGALELPGVFEEPLLPLDRFSGTLHWQREGERIQLSVPDLRFANADAEGSARLAWHTSDPAASGSRSRFPGVLDLQGQLSRAEGTRVHRYLPMDIPQDVRHYVRDAVRKGRASAVDFRLRGDLWDMPFKNPARGEFRIAAKVQDVQYAYVPHEHGGPSRWPVLGGLSGDLAFDRASMQLANVRGRLAAAPAVEIVRGEARIPDLEHSVLSVDAQARGPLGDLLRLGAPLAGGAHDFLAGIHAEGGGDYRLKLDLPIQATDQAKVQASVALAGNTLRLAPQTPDFTQARGTLDFTEGGFTVNGVQARLAGGDVRVEGRGRFDPNAGGDELDLRATGRLTAQGLREEGGIAWLAPLARRAEGATDYAVTVQQRRGGPEFSVSSDLRGLALDLPAPLGKPADAALPLRVAQTAAPAGDQIEAHLGGVASARLLRDTSGAAPRLTRGAVHIGAEAVEAGALPQAGLLANVVLDRLDVDEWRRLLSDGAGALDAQPPAAHAAPAPAASTAAWMPNLVAIRAGTFRVAGRTLHDVVLGGSREGELWRANIDARELSGYAEYGTQSAGRLYARLARLKIAPSEAHEVETLLDAQPDDLPALDVVVDDFELLGKRLGRAEIDAVNRGGHEREWRLNKLLLSTPEGVFSAKGSWAAPAGAAQGAPRRTAMDFHLDIEDAGVLLERFGMRGVLARGRGRMNGQVQWRGSPFSIDYPSLGGQVHLDMASGQFLKADPGIAKLLGVLSLQALPRRLTLDFRDVFSAGFAFDFIRGDARIHNGVAATNNLQMKGVNAAVLMDGQADVVRETQDLRVVVVPEVNAGTAALVATAINPAVGLGAFLAQMVLSRPLAVAATQEFHIDGTWADPKVNRTERRDLPKLPDLPQLPHLSDLPKLLPSPLGEGSPATQENRP